MNKLEKFQQTITSILAGGNDRLKDDLLILCQQYLLEEQSSAINNLLEEALAWLTQAFQNSSPPPPIPSSLETHAGFISLVDKMRHLRMFVDALARGDLSFTPNLKGYVLSSLKALQANLLHLTWQTQMVAGGDFTQQVDFMGDFSQAFNAMVKRLKGTMDALKSRELELSAINAELEKEIDRRQATAEQLQREKTNLERALVKIRDIETELRLQATTDSLTSLLNRRQFTASLDKEVRRAVRYQRHLCLLLIDIDHFKAINDKYGHPLGDEVLVHLGQVISQTSRRADYPCRIGGEEFAVILPETALAKGFAFAERLRQQVAQAPLSFPHGCLCRFTISCGLAVLQDTLSSAHELYKAADQALYRAKEAGRNRTEM